MQLVLTVRYPKSWTGAAYFTRKLLLSYWLRNCDFSTSQTQLFYREWLFWARNASGGVDAVGALSDFV